MEQVVAPVGLSKHEGAGNDFLIMIDLEDRVQLTAEEICWLADRHRGIGADGVITVTGPSGGGEVTMQLANHDGSPAEISGNGLRCVAHAVVRAGIVAPGGFSVMSGSGLRRVHCEPSAGRVAQSSAHMGRPQIEQLDAERRRAFVDIGNPHVIQVVDDLSAVDVERGGAEAQSLRDGGINVEWIEVRSRHELGMAVFERGVGPTLACGSGSVAAAAAVAALGLCDDQVAVDNPGGTLHVRFDDGDAVLSGEVRIIADLTVVLERSL